MYYVLCTMLSLLVSLFIYSFTNVTGLIVAVLSFDMFSPLTSKKILLLHRYFTYLFIFYYLNLPDMSRRAFYRSLTVQFSAEMWQSISDNQQYHSKKVF